MKTKFYLMTVLALFFVAIVPTWGQLTGTRFTIPFTFQVGKYELPAGEYRVSAVNDKALLISRIDGIEAVVVMTKAPVESPMATGRARLVFTSYEEKSFLSQVWLNREFGREVPKSAEETEYARIAQQKLAVVYSKSR